MASESKGFSLREQLEDKLYINPWYYFIHHLIAQTSYWYKTLSKSIKVLVLPTLPIFAQIIFGIRRRIMMKDLVE